MKAIGKQLKGYFTISVVQFRKAAKRILHYIRGTVQFGIHYSSGGTPLLVGFIDSDWVDDPDD